LAPQQLHSLSRHIILISIHYFNWS
jgi:hypothetical protein